MNRNITIMILILLFLGTLLQAQQNPLAGTWHIDVTSSLLLMPSDVKSKYDSLPQEIRARAELSMGSRTFRFTGDSLQVSWGSRAVPVISKGTWSYDSAESELTITIANDRQHFAIEFAESGTVFWTNKSPVGYFSRLCLKKQ